MAHLKVKGKKNWSTEMVMITKAQKNELVARGKASDCRTMSEVIQELLDAHQYCKQNNIQFRITNETPHTDN
jgi:hypothetical protein